MVSADDGVGERNQPVPPAVGKPWAEGVRFTDQAGDAERAVIHAEIANNPQPVVDIEGDRTTAAIQLEGEALGYKKDGISGRDVSFGRISRAAKQWPQGAS